MIYAALIAIALGTVAAYLAIMRAFDPHIREKGGIASLVVAVVAGGVSGLAAYAVETLLSYFGTGAVRATSPLLVSVLFTGQVEELAKFAAFLLVLHKTKAFKEPLDAVTHAAAAGLGFSVLESAFYGQWYGISVQFNRSFITTPGHMMLCALWGVYYAGVRTGQWKGRVWRSAPAVFFILIPSAALHGLYNHLIDARLGGLALAMDAVILVLLVVLVRMLRISSPYVARPDRWPLVDVRATLPTLHRALAAHPSSVTLNRKIAEALLRLRRYPTAIAHLDACLVREPRNREIGALKGSAMIVQGRTEEGTALLESAVRSAGDARRRTMEWNLLRTLGMRTPADTPKSQLVSRYLIVSSLRTPAVRPREHWSGQRTAPTESPPEVKTVQLGHEHAQRSPMLAREGRSPGTPGAPTRRPDARGPHRVPGGHR